jgi:toxin secretion/phage lysis holin
MTILLADIVNGVMVNQVPPDFIVNLLSSFHNSYPFVGQLFIIMLLDIVTGILAAFVTKTVNSATGWNGMTRKAIMLLVVSLGVILEPYANNIPLGKMIAFYFTVIEGLSILENVGRAGVPIPPVIRETLEKLRTVEKTNPIGVKDSVININNAHNVDVHDNPSGTTKGAEVVQRGDSVVIKGHSTEVVLRPDAVEKVVPKQEEKL